MWMWMSVEVVVDVKWTCSLPCSIIDNATTTTTRLDLNVRVSGAVTMDRCLLPTDFASDRLHDARKLQQHLSTHFIIHRPLSPPRFYHSATTLLGTLLPPLPPSKPSPRYISNLCSPHSSIQPCVASLARLPSSSLLHPPSASGPSSFLHRGLNLKGFEGTRRGLRSKESMYEVRDDELNTCQLCSHQSSIWRSLHMLQDRVRCLTSTRERENSG